MEKSEVDEFVFFNLKSRYQYLSSFSKAKNDYEYMYKENGNKNKEKKFGTLEYMFRKNGINTPYNQIWPWEPNSQLSDQEKRSLIQEMIEKYTSPCCWMCQKNSITESSIQPEKFGFLKMPEKLVFSSIAIDLSSESKKKKFLEQIEQRKKKEDLKLNEKFIFKEIKDENSKDFKEVVTSSLNILFKDFRMIMDKDANEDFIRLNQIPLGPKNKRCRSFVIKHKENRKEEEEIVSHGMIFVDEQNNGCIYDIWTKPDFRRKKLCTFILYRLVTIMVTEMKVNYIVGSASKEGLKIYSKFFDLEGVTLGSEFNTFLKFNLGVSWKCKFLHYFVKLLCYFGLF